MNMDFVEDADPIDFFTESESYWCPVGENGQTMEFNLGLLNDGWRKVPGLFMFISLSEQGFRILYIGQADNFSAEVPTHQKLDEAIKLGANYALSRVVRNQDERDRLECLMIHAIQPLMNT